MTEKLRTETFSLILPENAHPEASRSRENFSAKHFSVIVFLKGK